MMNLNPTILETVIQQAFDAATTSGGRDAKRWGVAIAKAKQQLETNPYMHFDGDALLILSPESNQIYRANGTCECIAYTRYGQPCFHRAAARIVKRYYEQTSH
jgi:hypothetical protein